MRLSDLLFKFDQSSILFQILDNAKNNSDAYVTVKEKENGFFVEPTNLFIEVFKAQKIDITIKSDFSLKSGQCGCLQFLKQHSCIHLTAIYAFGLALINRAEFDKEVGKYERKKQGAFHQAILEKLADDIKVSNPYFGQIHLIPVIEENDSQSYVLSLKIGFDKDYVVKSIKEFIDITENNIEYTYGQKLTFRHSYECFDKISKQFYDFLETIAQDDTDKSIVINKAQVLRIFEIYTNNVIFYKQRNKDKAYARFIYPTTMASIKLDDNYLSIVSPDNSELLLSGINNAYFIDQDNIYLYSYKSRTESRLYNYLFKVNGSLIIDVDSNKFISEVLPLIKKDISIDNEFYNKYPIPDISVNSYLSYVDNIMYLNPKISCDEPSRKSPYLKQLLDGYFKTVEGYQFVRNKDRKYIIEDLGLQYKFLTDDLSNLKSFGNVYFDEDMKAVKTKKSTKTRVSISYNVGLLEFKFSNGELSEEDIQAMLKAYHEKKKFIKLKDNTILEIDEESAKEIDDFMEDFNISIRDLNKPISKPLNYLLKLVNGGDPMVDMDNDIIRIIKEIQNYKKSKYLPNAPLNDILRNYQIEGYRWLKTLSNFGFGGILADDMGLGKTLEVISFLESDDKAMPSLIVCPMSLVYNWEIECEKWKYQAPVKLIIGPSDIREEMINNIKPDEKILYITSYDSLRRDMNIYKERFRFVIADEAQFIKNQFAQKSEAIKSIKSEINFALTGTPIENGLADLWSIFDFLMPGYLSNYSHFKSRYESLIVHDDDEALNNLKKRVSPFILRRTKKDVLKDLPDKIEDYYYCKMEDKQKEVYDIYVEKLKDDLKNGGNNVLALLTRLRQICITPELILQEPFENTKINMAVDLIKSSIEAGHRILVFSQFAQSFPIISKELDNMGIKHFILDGQTKAKVRMEMVSEFNSNDDIKVFIISLKAGGTGLNLVGADMVIHLDPWWNSSAEAQATDRAYRIGQEKNVTVIKLICKNTIEEKVVKLQGIKKELAESIVVSDDAKKPFKLTRNDILELLE